MSIDVSFGGWGRNSGGLRRPPNRMSVENDRRILGKAAGQVDADDPPDDQRVDLRHPAAVPRIVAAAERRDGFAVGELAASFFHCLAQPEVILGRDAREAVETDQTDVVE